MNPSIANLQGVYLAYPTSPELKSIYKAKDYKTKVNNQHTKIGKADSSFANAMSRYTSSFDGEIKFVPIASVDKQAIEIVEASIKKEMNSRFKRLGRAREWFDTDDRKQVRDVILQVIINAGVSYTVLTTAEQL
jgi:hypothetical protein